jgi:hypothetical protein
MIAKVKEIGKYNTAILKLIKIIITLNERQLDLLLKIAEELFIKEKRANNRRECRAPIYYATSDRVYTGHIENISPTGLFIKAEKALPPGEEILMTFNIKGLDKPIKVRGEIAHANDEGLGVQFKNLNPNILKILEKFVVKTQKRTPSE